MTSVKARRSRSPGWFLALVVVAGLLVIGIAVAFVYVASGGVITVPFTDPPRVFSLETKVPEKPWTPPAGKVMVPIAGRAIPAYTKLTRDDTWDPKVQRATTWPVGPEEVSRDAIITDFDKVWGRVLKREKPKGYVFRETDFLPEGTRPGLVAGIPPGMRGMRVELSKVRGLFDLLPGDRFDLVSTIAVSTDTSQDLRKMGGAYADRLAMEATAAGVTKQATVRVVVQNGVVVEPVQTNEVPVSIASLTQGARTNSKPVQEVLIAVSPAEAVALAEALAIEAELTVVPRSGRPDDPQDSVTPDRLPKSPFGASADTGSQDGASVRFVETIDGTNREIVPVPSSGGAGKPEAPRAK
jgi:Flp pilus assembly protein CpaB